MVKKLFKYEWISARRFLVPLSLVLIGLSVAYDIVAFLAGFDRPAVTFVTEHIPYWL